MGIPADRRAAAWCPRVMAAALAVVVTAPARVEGQLLHDSTRLVEVFGTPTRVLALGLENRQPGEPVVLLQSGAGTALEGWGDWPLQLSELAPVVGYDRPGLGESPFDGVDPTPERVAVHLHELLDVLDIAPPYVLLGHSWGGPLILYFAAKYPGEVAGMAYIDPQDPRISRAEMLLTDDEVEMDRRDAAYAEAVTALQEAGTTSPGRAAESRVRTEFSKRTPAGRDVPDDPALPTAVVLSTRTPDMTGAPYYINADWFREYHHVRVGRFADWALGRPDTILIITTDSGHFVHLDQPALATAGVKHVLARIQASRLWRTGLNGRTTSLGRRQITSGPPAAAASDPTGPSLASVGQRR